MNDVILIQHIRYTYIYITYYIHIYPSIHLATLLWNIVSSSWGRTAVVASENGSRRTGELHRCLERVGAFSPRFRSANLGIFEAPKGWIFGDGAEGKFLKLKLVAWEQMGKIMKDLPPQNEVTFATKKGLHDFANWSFWTFPDGAHQNEVGQKVLEFYTFTKINTYIISPQRNAIP